MRGKIANNNCKLNRKTIKYVIIILLWEAILFGKKIPIIFTAHSKEKERIPFDVNVIHVFYWDENEENKFLKEVR